MNQMNRIAWVENLKEQHPGYEAVIDEAVADAAGFYGLDFGDAVLGALEEAGAVV